MGNYMGQASAYTRNKKYKTGTLTYAQLMARRANMQTARLAKGEGRHTSAHHWSAGFHHTTAKSRGTAAADRAYKELYINSAKGSPLGSKWIKYEAKAHLHKPRINGLKTRTFMKSISTGRYLGRTSWSRGRRTSGFHKVIKPRVHRFKRQSHWRKRGHVVVPT